MPPPTASLHTEELRSDFRGFHRLMPHRVENVLLVCSLYESFILEEDGLVADLISSEFLEMNLSHAPRVSRVSTGSEALRLMEHEHFDLVITMTRLGDWNVCELASEVKRVQPRCAVVVLADEPRDLARYAGLASRRNVDQFFVWNGDAKILLAIIKYIEDRRNAEDDTTNGDVRVIILIEDSVRFYSAYLPLIYAEVMKLTQTLMAGEVSSVRKLLRMRARPKILHATSFEEAWSLFTQFSQNVLGVITDVRFPRQGELDPEAGVELARRIKGVSPLMPVLVQSSDEHMRDAAAILGAGFLHKQAPTLLQDLRDFLLLNLGFGEFVFRMPDGVEVGRAADLRTLAALIRQVPDSSIRYHADSNHFSNWLMARTEFELASLLRPRRVSDFKEISDLRSYLCAAVTDAYTQSDTTVVAEFSRQRFTSATEFTRISGGAMGGKARGLAFIRALLDRYGVTNEFPGVRICVPRSAAIGTDTFDEFLDTNSLHQVVARDTSDESIRRAFLEGRLPRALQRDLSAYLSVVEYPLAVRSSSLLEDSHGQPFAGIYQTYMIPNNHRSRRVRLQRLSDAIKLVYASTYSNAAKRYLGATDHHIEEEKMGVVVQELVGHRFGSCFYPSFSGVARSFNFYPFGNVKPEEGVACVALGLGKSVVEGEEMLMFSPAHPQSLPQFSTPKAALSNSQRRFYALDMTCEYELEGDLRSDCVRKLQLDQAERDGTLAPIGSVYSRENDAIYDGINRPGPRIVSFAHVLKSGVFPLADIIKRLLRLGKRAMACPVEIEFAVHLQAEPKEFALLQIRPIIADESFMGVEVDDADRDNAICFSPQTMGNGSVRGLRDIVYVVPERFDPARSRDIAAEVAVLNRRMHDAGRRYILIGPGRWGSADPWLGIPVTWNHISASQVIVETSLNDYVVTPSQGTHFFQNLTSFRIGYLTVNPTVGGGHVDWDWLAQCPSDTGTDHLRHVQLPADAEVRLDGRSRRGVILKPGPAVED